MVDRAELLTAKRAAIDRQLAAAEKHFAKIIREAALGGMYGHFGLVCSFREGEIQMHRVQWERHIKPDEPA
jgi:hypothetical protein